MPEGGRDRGVLRADQAGAVGVGVRVDRDPPPQALGGDDPRGRPHLLGGLHLAGVQRVGVRGAADLHTPEQEGGRGGPEDQARVVAPGARPHGVRRPSATRISRTATESPIRVQAVGITRWRAISFAISPGMI